MKKHARSNPPKTLIDKNNNIVIPSKVSLDNYKDFNKNGELFCVEDGREAQLFKRNTPNGSKIYARHKAGTLTSNGRDKSIIHEKAKKFLVKGAPFYIEPPMVMDYLGHISTIRNLTDTSLVPKKRYFYEYDPFILDWPEYPFSTLEAVHNKNEPLMTKRLCENRTQFVIENVEFEKRIYLNDGSYIIVDAYLTLKHEETGNIVNTAVELRYMHAKDKNDISKFRELDLSVVEIYLCDLVGKGEEAIQHRVLGIDDNFGRETLFISFGRDLFNDNYSLMYSSNFESISPVSYDIQRMLIKRTISGISSRVTKPTPKDYHLWSDLVKHIPIVMFTIVDTPDPNFNIKLAINVVKNASVTKEINGKLYNNLHRVRYKDIFTPDFTPGGFKYAITPNTKEILYKNMDEYNEYLPCFASKLDLDYVVNARTEGFKAEHFNDMLESAVLGGEDI